MRTPLIERLPTGSPQLALFDERLDRVEHRRSARRYSRETNKAYARRFRRWEEWCAARGYQSAPQFITTEKLVEHTQWMVSVRRYSPATIVQALRALQIYAERAGVFVAVEPAYGVATAWRQQLRDMDLIPPRKRRNGLD